MPSSKSDKKFLKELKRKELKRKKLKEKKRSRHRVKSDSSSDSSSDGSDMDLQKEMYPISHYVNDREEMINQVFSVIKGAKLKSMLPPFLVELEIDELKGLCLEQLIGMSKKRISCVLAGQEMVESSDTDDDSDINSDDTDIGDNGRESVELRKAGGDRSGEDEDLKEKKSVVSEDPGAATRLQKVNRINFGKKEVAKVVLSGDKKKRERKESEKREGSEGKKDKGEKGKTLMELLELEMRARAIKALLMKAGKEEGEAETLAIEEALDEQKKKVKDGTNELKKDRNIRKRNVENEEESLEVEQGSVAKKKKEVSDEEEAVEEPEKVYNSENKAMNKAREALMLSENRKLIQDEIKQRKEEEAKFMYEEQLRKEKMEKEKEEREKLIQEVKLMKQKMVESEQEERRKVLEKEREKMKKDHMKKEQQKQLRDKEKLLTKIKAIKDEEEREKEMLDEHYKTKMTKKIVERADEDDELVLDEDEEQKMRRYRRKEDGIEGSDQDEEGEDMSREEYDRDRSRSRSDSRERVRKPYSRDRSWSPGSKSDSDSENKKSHFGGKTRLKKKVADGSDVEDGEVEEVDSDAEDEVDREEDQLQLLEKMKNLRKKLLKVEDKADDAGATSGTTSPQPINSGRGGRGRGRAPRGRGRGRGRGKAGSGSDDDEWSMKKYDFDAPDIKEAVESHKPNFVKAPRRVFEKHDGYYSEDEEEEVDMEVDEREDQSKDDVSDTAAVEEVSNESQLNKFIQRDDDNESDLKESNPDAAIEGETPLKSEKDEFKRVTRAEWNKMGYKEKKKYLKERRKRKQQDTVFIKDDSDNEQLSCEDEDMEDLEFSDSEDEKDKGERLAKEALKSYAKAFTKEEHPEDYKLVMRKDTVEAELADEGDTNYETIEDIELRDKREKIEMKEKEKKDKMREDRLKRMQAFQASSILREEPNVEEDDEEIEDEEDEVIEEKEPEAENNPFYSSYKEALAINEEELEDPLKEERERSRMKLEEDEKELKKIEEEGQLKNLKESPEPQSKKPKTDFDKFSGVGALKTMLDSEKEKIQKELAEGEAKSAVETALEEEKRKKTAEKVLKKSRRRGDPNNPSKEEMDAAQELEQLTWQDRYMKNKRVKDVVSSSKMFSKVKNKLKLEKNEKEQDIVPGSDMEDASEVKIKETAKPVATNSELPGMIGSLEEYASLVGKKVSQLAESKYEPPEVESSDDDSEEEGDLWGAIMGGK